MSVQVGRCLVAWCDCQDHGRSAKKPPRPLLSLDAFSLQIGSNFFDSHNVSSQGSLTSCLPLQPHDCVSVPLLIDAFNAQNTKGCFAVIAFSVDGHSQAWSLLWSTVARPTALLLFSERLGLLFLVLSFPNYQTAIPAQDYSWLAWSCLICDHAAGIRLQHLDILKVPASMQDTATILTLFDANNEGDHAVDLEYGDGKTMRYDASSLFCVRSAGALAFSLGLSSGCRSR